MFKNCVLKPDVNTIKWAKAAGIRAIKTMAQAAIGAIGAAVTLGAVDWCSWIHRCTGRSGVIIDQRGRPAGSRRSENNT